MSTSMDVDNEHPRGTKRTAEAAELFQNDAPKRIKALDQDVVNKIAAGEIIVAPVHALKELLENAVDAGSSALEIAVKDGGLKFLQITDNGHGINRDDLPILCERFTTSKLKAFEDLTSIGTYGFRGEALASISHIAHLSVTTKVKESSCAYRAHYSSGKLVPAKPGLSAEPTPIAGRPGTQITVEDLFYNVPSRRKAFRSPSEEYAKILDLVGRYAVHCVGVSFSCKKHGDASLSISIPPTATLTDRIRSIHGSSVATNLIKYSSESETYGYKASGHATNANYQGKRTTLLLFINSRSVEAIAVKKALEATYSQFLPKGAHPFIYLNLEIDPARVDVNVHPTKKEVHFLDEDEIIADICEAVRESLVSVDTSRSFKTQTLLPGSSKDFMEVIEPITPQNTSRNSRLPTRIYENNLIRTDPRSRKITSMFQTISAPNDVPELESLQRDEAGISESPSREFVPCKLTSVRNLRLAVKNDMHHGLTQSLATHTFVGIVDTGRRLAAIQSGVKLLLVDYGMFSNALFYQLGLTDFGNFGTFKLSPALPLVELLDIGAKAERQRMISSQPSQYESETEADSIDWENIKSKVYTQLMARRDMLSEYFQLNISPEGEVETLPLLLKGYEPPMTKLPRFLLGLGPKIDWTAEQPCFATFLTQLAEWYVPESMPLLEKERTETEDAPIEDDDVREERKKRKDHLMHALEHVMFPALKARLVATNDLLKGVVEAADLKGLYRVFERC